MALSYASGQALTAIFCRTQLGVTHTLHIEVEGAPPWIALGCVALFPRRDGPMRLEAFDPEEDAEEVIALNVTRDQFMLAYYAPFLRVLAFAGLVRDDFFYTAELGESGVRMRLPVSIVDRVRQALNRPEGLCEDILGTLDEIQGRWEGVRPDGSVIEANWQGLLREG